VLGPREAQILGKITVDGKDAKLRATRAFLAGSFGMLFQRRRAVLNASPLAKRRLLGF